MIWLPGEQESAGHLEEEIRDAFSPEGLLSRSRDFEYRPQQQELAVHIARALEQRSSLVAEAGTGVGKSLAYLLPAAQYAISSNRKAVISTHTINLQEQLIHKDIPIARKLLGVDLPAALLKGRQNYLCPLRLRRALMQSQDLFTGSEHEELQQIEEWARRTKDGTRSDLDFETSARVWLQVCSEAAVCTLRNCGHRGDCFFQEARKRAAEAQLVVVNHTLFFALMAGGEQRMEEGVSGFLFPDDFVILDEGHTIEQVAAVQLGLQVSQAGVNFNLQRLYDKRRHKGLLKSYGRARLLQAVEDARVAVGHFFESVGEAAQFGQWSREWRVREIDIVPNVVSSPLRELWQEIDSVAEVIENEVSKNELQDASRRIREIHGAIATFLDQRDEECVYWIQKSGTNNDQFSLNGAPINIADRLRPLLFGQENSCIITSATLAVGDSSLKWFRDRVGAEDVPAQAIGSPFDYASQMKLCIWKDIPEPNADNYESVLIEAIRKAVDMSSGRAFVLFTSYRMMREAANVLRDEFRHQGWKLLVQGEKIPRRRMVEIFREDISSVLFGTASFWTGVDVPGEALSNVVVTRLPFSVPDHPLTQAKIELIEAAGGNAFMEYSVPEAILKLRQGVGRLIRTQRDEGWVCLLDSRILTKRYGKLFLDALPNAKRELI